MRNLEVHHREFLKSMNWSTRVVPSYIHSNCPAGLAELEVKLENGDRLTESLGGRWIFEFEMVRII